MEDKKTFRLHWGKDSIEYAYGHTIAEAFRDAGYGGGAINALDHYEEVKEDKFKKYVILRGIKLGNTFYSSNDPNESEEDKCKMYTGETVYTIVGYVNSSDAAEMVIQGRLARDIPFNELMQMGVNRTITNMVRMMKDE